jgi:hypothetical protein
MKKLSFGKQGMKLAYHWTGLKTSLLRLAFEALRGFSYKK